jgi:hypothetical protein
VPTKTPIEPNAIYTREESAHLLGISLSTLKLLIRTGQLKVSQPLGLRRVFIRGSSILEMLDASERIGWVGQIPHLDPRQENKPAMAGHMSRARQRPAHTRSHTARGSNRAVGGGEPLN